MFLATRPTASGPSSASSRNRRTLPFSYEPVGAAQREPDGYNVDETVVTIGRGQADFDRAKAALAAWKHFDIGWVQAIPAAAKPEPGTVVAVVDSSSRPLVAERLPRRLRRRRSRIAERRSGLRTARCVNHAEAGEELFEVFMDPSSGEVMYRIRAVSRPRAALAWIGYPLVRCASEPMPP